MEHRSNTKDEEEWIDIGTDMFKSHHTIELPEPITENTVARRDSSENERDDIYTNDLIASMDNKMSRIVPYNEIEYDRNKRCFVKMTPTEDKYTPECISNTFKEWCTFAYWHICLYIEHAHVFAKIMNKRSQLLYNQLVNWMREQHYI